MSKNFITLKDVIDFLDKPNKNNYVNIFKDIPPKININDINKPVILLSDDFYNILYNNIS